jgi:hypothetical protein
MDEELNKFCSSAGSGLHGASGFLRNAKLPDTIHLGIRRRDVVLGSIKCGTNTGGILYLS